MINYTLVQHIALKFKEIKLVYTIVFSESVYGLVHLPGSRLKCFLLCNKHIYLYDLCNK